jgi:hypothetical protein
MPRCAAMRSTNAAAAVVSMYPGATALMRTPPFVRPTFGLYLYFPVRTQGQPKLRALIDQALAVAEEGQLDR